MIVWRPGAVEGMCKPVDQTSTDAVTYLVVVDGSSQDPAFMLPLP